MAGAGSSDHPITPPLPDSGPERAKPRAPRQTSLFSPTAEPAKVIPFPIPRPLASKAPPRPPRRPGGAPPKPAGGANQQSLNLAPPTLQAEPAAWREARVAPASTRCAAAAVDGLVVLVGLGLFFVPFYRLGGQLVLAPKALYGYGALVVTLAFFYHLYWSILNRETVGMRCLRLRLLNFDGYKPNGRQRLIRLGGACLSLAALGVGLVWALVDQEKLTWHDHMSQTFPTDSAPPARAR